MTDQLVLLDVAAGVATLTLNNPPLNLNSRAMTRALWAALDRIEADAAIRAVIVTAVGDRAFCAGSDIKEFRELYDAGTVVSGKLQIENDTFTRLARLDKPTVAFLNGLAYGGGLELAVCCDLRVAEEHVKLALPEILLGAFPGSGGTIRVPQLIGAARAKQMVFLGDPIDAATALSWGLVNYVVPRGEGRAFAAGLAARLADRPQTSLAFAKQSIHDAMVLPDDETIPDMLEKSGVTFALPDTLEGITAFAEKRKPRFNPEAGEPA